MEGSRFDVPADLPSQGASAQCKTDVIITATEPNVEPIFGSSVGDTDTGLSWTGVVGVTVTLRAGGVRYEGVTDRQGRATIRDVPCGAYSCYMTQDELTVARLNTRQTFNVNASRKSGREFEEPVRRRMKTIEMFKLPTMYLMAAGIKETPPNSDDTYGHHWLKIYDTENDARREQARDSYGWWPKYGVGGSMDAITGVEGSLNGYPTYTSSRLRDPYHTKSRTYANLEDVFFPFVSNGYPANYYKDKVRTLAQNFETDVSNEWSWRTNGGGWHCKTFQAYIMSHAHLWRSMLVSPGEFIWRVSV